MPQIIKISDQLSLNLSYSGSTYYQVEPFYSDIIESNSAGLVTGLTLGKGLMGFYDTNTNELLDKVIILVVND